MMPVKTVDCHAHILPLACIEQLARLSELVAPRLIRLGDGQTIMEIAGKVVQRPMPPECWDVDRRLRDMDTNGVEMQLLATVIHTFFYDVEPSLAQACAELQNDSLADLIGQHPSRFFGLATLPMQSPQAAADELRRAMQSLGLRGAQIGSNVNGVNLDDPALDSLWAVAAELGAFILVHPCGEVLPGDRLKSYYMRNYVGLPFETTMAGAALVFGGVVERHPGIRFCLSHGGGFLPYQAARFVHAWEVRAEPRQRLRGTPSDSIARLYFDSIVHGTEQLEFLVKSCGADHVLLGSDYPFDMGTPDCVAKVRATSLPDAEQRAVLGGTALALLG